MSFAFFPQRSKSSRKASAPSRRRGKSALVLETLEDRSVPSCNTISGYVYNDINGNGLFDQGEPPIANSPIELRNASNQVVGSTTTDQNGFYKFDADMTVDATPKDLVQEITYPSTKTNFSLSQLVNQFDSSLGDLLSVEIIEDGSITSAIKVENTSESSASSIASTVSGKLTLKGPGFTLDLNLQENADTYDASSYDGITDFGGTSGKSFASKTANGTNSITLTGNQMNGFLGTGKVSLTQDALATSFANGGGNLVVALNSTATAKVKVIYHYKPNNCLEPGAYTIYQTQQPAGYLDGKESRNGTVLNTPPGQDSIPLTLGDQDLPNNNFGELKAASLSGYVWHDVNNDGVKDPGEAGIANVQVMMVANTDQGQSTTKVNTDANGFYAFNDLRPGTYRLIESQPNGYLDGKDSIGSQSGTPANDYFYNIVLPGGVSGVNNNFGEVKPSGLTGHVWEDSNDNGVMDPGEAGIAGVTVTLAGSDDIGAVNKTTTTDANGYYKFGNLRPGTYSIAETQPASHKDGKDAIGTQGGDTVNDLFFDIILGTGVIGINNDFGELPKDVSDLGIVKEVDQASVLVGSILTYTVTVTNYGTHTAQDVVVTDELPPTATFLGSNAPGWGVSKNGTIVTLTTPSLAVGATASFQITIQAPLVVGNLVNTVTVTSKTPDNNPNNNKSTVTTTVYNKPGEELPRTVTPLVTAFGNPKVPITSKRQLLASTYKTVPLAPQQVAIRTFVDGAYRTLLGRAGTQQEVEYYANQLNNGMSRETLIAQLWNNDGHRALQANELYETFLNRKPTAGEQAAIISSLKAGASELSLALNLLTSSEYLQVHSGPQGFIIGIHQDVLGRVPDLATQLTLAQAMGNTTVGAFAQSMLTSSESYLRIADAGIRAVLRRLPLAGEAEAYAAQLQSGALTPAELMQKLLVSNEFYVLARNSAK